MNASIIAVGTELTTGQILNRNGSWLSQKLKTYGLEVACHLVVPDDKAEILRALDFCSLSDVIFVTGGLGPTSDDFTRDVIAEKAKAKLVFDETSWKHVNERLTSRGFTVKDMQRQQCYFPEGATILQNSNGTANGFSLQLQKQMYFVLPGPPREIEAIWHDWVQSWIEKASRNLDKKITKSWDTIGVGESDVAQIVESVFKDAPKTLPIEIGYRVHLPYVEVKLTYPESTSYTCELYVQKVNLALMHITALRDFKDVTELFRTYLGQEEFVIYDFVTQGFLLNRLSPVLKSKPNWTFRQSPDSMDSDFFAGEKNFLALLPDRNSNNENNCWLLGEWNGVQIQKNIEAPMKSNLMLERRRQYFAEMALLFFVNPSMHFGTN